MIERGYIAGTVDVDIDTFADRLRDEAAADCMVNNLPRLVGAWVPKGLTSLSCRAVPLREGACHESN